MQGFVGIILVILGVLLYVLYDRGYLPVKSMSAIHFIGSMGAGTNKASAAFGSASGQIRRVLRFKESKPYEFTFKGKITKGSVQAYVLECNKIPDLVLDNDCPSGIVHAVKGQRYYLVIRFQNASGEYTLSWQ